MCGLFVEVSKHGAPAEDALKTESGSTSTASRQVAIKTQINPARAEQPRACTEDEDGSYMRVFVPLWPGLVDPLMDKTKPLHLK